MTIAIKTNTAVGYFRVSAPGQAGERHVSLEVQQAAYEDFCRSRNLTPVKTFVDVASGRKDNRPQYQAMLEYVAREGVGNVVVLFLDRFGRNPKEILRRYWDLGEQGIEVKSINEDLREELLLLVRAGIAGADSKRTAERVTMALRTAASAGKLVNKLPYGLTKVRDSQGERVEIVPGEAEAIRSAYELATVQNMGYKAVADELNRRGHRTKSGALFAAQSVKLILLNQALVGRMVFKGSIGDAVVIERAYPPILTDAEWDLLQERLTIRRQGLGHGRTHSSVYLLSGILRCGECGGAMSGEFKGKFRYYTCSNKKMAQALCNGGKNHRQDSLEEALLSYLGQFSDPETVRQLLEAQSQEIDYKAVQELARVDKRLGELEKAFLNDLDRVDREIMTESEYLKRQEVRREEQDGLKVVKVELEGIVAAQKDLEATVTTVPAKIATFLEDVQGMDVREAKAVFQGILKAAHVFNDGRVELEFRV